MAILKSDSFSAADGAINGTALDAALGGSAGTWTANAGVSRLGTKVGPTDTAFNLAGVDASVTDGYAEFIYDTAHGTGVYVLGRTVDGNNAYRLNVSTTGVLVIESVVASAVTALWTSSAGVGNVGDRIGMGVFGSNIAAYVNGVLLQTVSDSAVTAGTLWGLCFGNAGGTTGRLDNWKLSDSALVTAPLGAYLPVRIPNRKVGPMALRHNFQQVLKLSYTAPPVTTVITPLPAMLTVGRVADRRTDFSLQADTSTPSTTDDTGQTATHATTVTNNPVILGGAWTQNTGPGAVYRWFDDGVPVTRIGVRFRFDNLGGAQTTNGGAVALSMMNNAFNAGDPTVRFGAHFVITPTNWALQTYRNDTSVFTDLGGAAFGSPLVKDNTTIYTVEVYRWNDTVGLVLPDGTTTQITHPDIAAWSGNFGFIETITNVSTDNYGRITRYWADFGVQPDQIPTPGTFAPNVIVGAPVPAFASAGAQNVTGTTAQNVPVPAGVVAGDVILVFIYDDPGTVSVSGVPTGFTQVSSPVTSAAPNPIKCDVYWKRATGADSGTYNFTLGSTPTFNAGIACRYTGCILSGSPIEAVNSVGISSASVNFAATSLTTNGSNRLIVWSGRFRDGAATCTQPSGFTSNTSTPGSGVAHASMAQAAAGSTGSLTASVDAGFTDSKVAWVAALLPTTLTVTPAAATLTLTGSAPILNLTVSPTGTTLTLTGSAPTVVTSVTPTAATLTLTGSAPRLDLTVRPAAATLTLTGSAPTVVLPVTPTSASLTLTSGTPSLDLTVRPTAATLALTGSAPVLVAPQLVTPTGAALTLTGSAPRLDTGLKPAGATLTLVSGTPVLVAPQLVTSTGAALTLTGSAPQLDTGVRPVAATLALTGAAPTVVLPVTPTGAALTLTGSAPAISLGMIVAPSAATVTLTGGTPIVTLSNNITVLPGAATLTLTGAIPPLGTGVSPTGSVLTLTGSAPSVVVGINITPTGATLTLTGSAPTVLTPQTFTPTAAALALTGSTPLVGSGLRPAGASLTLTGATPALDTGVRPTGAALALTAGTPILVAPQLVTPTSASLTLTGFAPNVGGNQVFVPATATLMLTGSAPTVVTPVMPTAAALALAGAVPRLDTGLRPTNASPTLTGAAPTVVLPVTPFAATLTLTGGTPSVGITVTPAAATLTLTGSAPTIITPQTVTPTASSLTLTGSAPRLDTAVRPVGAALTLIAGTPALITPQVVAPVGGALTLTGSAPNIGGNQTFIPSSTTVALTGSAPIVTATANQTVTPGAVTLALTGSTPRLDTGVGPAGAALALAAGTPVLVAPQLVTPTAATLTLTGSAPVVSTPKLIAPTSATLTLTGAAPVLVAPQLVTPATVALTLTGSVPRLDITIRPAGAALTLTGQTPALTLPQLVTPTAPTLVLAGQSPLILIPLVIIPAPTLFTLTGQGPTLRIAALAGATPARTTLADIGKRTTVVDMPDRKT